MYKPGYILSKIEKHAYYIGLLPYQFMNMTIKEIFTAYEQRMKLLKDKNDCENRRTARICCIIANANRDSKKKPRPFMEDDFIPKEKLKEKKKMNVNQMETLLKTITLAYGGKVVN